jgi:hypothetical protein
MAEQWPFKPFVESSTLSELTKVILFGWLFVLTFYNVVARRRTSAEAISNLVGKSR